jgi:hypothetical protein
MMLRKLLFINTSTKCDALRAKRENDTMPAIYPFIDYLILGILVFVAYKIIKLD